MKVVRCLQTVSNLAASRGFAVQWKAGAEYDLSKQSGVVQLTKEPSSVDNVWNALVTPEEKKMVCMVGGYCTRYWLGMHLLTTSCRK